MVRWWWRYLHTYVFAGYVSKEILFWKVIYIYICVYSIVPEGYGNTTHYLHPSWDSRNVEPSLYVLGRSMQLWRTDESSFGMLGRRERTWFGLGWLEIGGAWRIRYLLLSWAVDVSFDGWKFSMASGMQERGERIDCYTAGVWTGSDIFCSYGLAMG